MGRQRAVQTIKNLIKKSQTDNKDFQLALLDFQNTPTDDNIGSPAQRLMGQCTKMLLLASEDLLMPKTISSSTVKLELRNQKAKQKFYHDCSTNPLDPLHEGEKVLFQEDGKWMPAVIEKETHLP